MTGEVKPQDTDHAATFMQKDKAEGKAVWTNEEYNDAAQMYHYAAAQFQSRPQRGLFSFSVTGQFIQFWYWTPSGVMYTDGLDYSDQEGVKTIMAFFRTWEAAAPCQRGEDVAPTDLEEWVNDYTFQEVEVEEAYHARWRKILGALSSSFESFIDIPKKPQMVYWKFKHGPIAEPVEDLRPPEGYGEDTEDFDEKPPMISTDYYFHVPASSTAVEGLLTSRTGVIDPDQRCPHLPGDEVELIVIPYAIRRLPGLCSRATSCYAVVFFPTAFPGNPNEDIVRGIFRFHTLKLSWQYFNRVHELIWYTRLQGKDLAGWIRYVARHLEAARLHQ